MVKKWGLRFTPQSQKDAKKIKMAGLKTKVEKILGVLESNPFEPPYEKLIGDLEGAYSRRINIQHRVVYQVMKKQKIVKIIRLWTHYE